MPSLRVFLVFVTAISTCTLVILLQGCEQPTSDVASQTAADNTVTQSPPCQTTADGMGRCFAQPKPVYTAYIACIQFLQDDYDDLHFQINVAEPDDKPRVVQLPMKTTLQPTIASIPFESSDPNCQQGSREVCSKSQNNTWQTAKRQCETLRVNPKIVTKCEKTLRGKMRIFCSVENLDACTAFPAPILGT